MSRFSRFDSILIQLSSISLASAVETSAVTMKLLLDGEMNTNKWECYDWIVSQLEKSLREKQVSRVLYLLQGILCLLEEGNIGDITVDRVTTFFRVIGMVLQDGFAELNRLLHQVVLKACENETFRNEQLQFVRSNLHHLSESDYKISSVEQDYPFSKSLFLQYLTRVSIVLDRDFLFEECLQLVENPEETWVLEILALAEDSQLDRIYNEKLSPKNKSSLRIESIVWLLCQHYSLLLCRPILQSELDVLVLDTCALVLSTMPKQALYLLHTRSLHLDEETRGKWNVFFRLYDVQDTFEQHLVKENLPQLKWLLYSKKNDGFHVWTALLLKKMLTHSNSALRKYMLLYFLRFEFSNKEGCINLTLEFLFDSIFQSISGVCFGILAHAVTKFYINFFRLIGEDEFESIGMHSKDSLGNKTIFLRRFIDSLPQIISPTTLYALLDAISQFPTCLALNDQSCFSLQRVVSNMLMFDEYHRIKLFSKAVIILKHLDISISLPNLGKLLKSFPIARLKNCSTLMWHSKMDNLDWFFISSRVELAGSAARLFSLGGISSFGEEFSRISSGIYSHTYMENSKKDFFVHFLKHLLSDIIGLVDISTPDNSISNSVRLKFPELMNQLNAIITSSYSEICSFLGSLLYMTKLSYTTELYDFHSIANINLVSELLTDLLTLFPHVAQSYYSSFTLNSLSSDSMLCTVSNLCIVDSIVNSRLDFHTPESIEFILDLQPMLKNEAILKAEVESWNELRIMFYKFKWNILSKIFSIISPNCLSPLFARKVVNSVIDGLGTCTLSYANTIFQALKFVLPIALADTEASLAFIMVENVVNAASTTLDEICSVGNEDSILSVEGYLDAITSPILFRFENLHDNGPIYLSLRKFFMKGLTRSIRIAYMVSTFLFPALLLEPEFAHYYNDIISDLCIYIKPEGVMFIESAVDLEEDDTSKPIISTYNKDMMTVVRPEINESTPFDILDAGDAQAGLVRAIALHFLSELGKVVHTSSNKRGSDAQKFLNQLVLHFINEKHDSIKISSTQLHTWSRPSMYKCSLWQSLCVLCPGVSTNLEFISLLCDRAWNRWGDKNRPDTQHYIELVLAFCFKLHPKLITSVLYPALNESSSMCPFHLGSLLLLSIFIFSDLNPEQIALHSDLFLKTIIPFTTSNFGQTRTLSQYVWSLIFGKYSNACTASSDIYSSMNAYLAENADSKKIQLKYKSLFESYDLASMYTAEKYMPLLSYAEKTVHSLISMASSEILTEIKLQYQKNEEFEVAKRGLKNSEIDFVLSDYQKKIAPLESSFLEMINEAKPRNMVIATRRKKFDVIVVASLLDRVPNLAGLCRTCEIFNAEKLILHDKKVIKDPSFESIAVSSHLWVPIEEVRECDVAKYLLDRKVDGYTVLALEQTMNSVSLENYHFPSKIVILLGKEKEGIPVSLIQLVDKCIQIPQFGLIRSLNVHVSGAILLWSYVRQYCLEQNK